MYGVCVHMRSYVSSVGVLNYDNWLWYSYSRGQ